MLPTIWENLLRIRIDQVNVRYAQNLLQVYAKNAQKQQQQLWFARECFAFNSFELQHFDAKTNWLLHTFQDFPKQPARR